jgi:hypothetical protein
MPINSDALASNVRYRDQSPEVAIPLSANCGHQAIAGRP